MKKTRNIHSFMVRTIDGKEQSLADFVGKALLIVNTASRCGFTPQYKALEILYQRFKAQGFEVLAFPANDFMNQDPGTNNEIKNFCQQHFNITFPLFAKVCVRGKDIHPLFHYLTKEAGVDGAIKWNFSKFLIDPEGRLVARFESSLDPLSSNLVEALQQVLPVSKQPS